MHRTALRSFLVSILIMLIAGTAAARAEPSRESTNAGRVRLVLPPVIYSIPGIEANLYLDNVLLVLNRANYACWVNCEKGIQLDERWTFTPEAKDIGEYPLEVVVRDENNQEVARGKTLVRVSPADRKPAGPTTLLLVGDSLTDTLYSHYPQRLIVLDEKDESLDLKLIGSRGMKDDPPSGPLRHEGYSGWTAEAFVTIYGTNSRKGVYKRPETGSPFLYNDEATGKPRFDFARYCAEFNDSKGPDGILIILGTNDIFTAKDETIDDVISKSLGFYDVLIREFHSVRSDTCIGVVMPTPASRSQDGFRNYKGVGKQTSWQYRRNQHRMVERMAERFANREAEHIYLVPAYVNLDTVRNFPTWSAAPNANATEKVTRVNNGTHPNEQGHHQIADTIYCWVKSVVAAGK